MRVAFIIIIGAIVFSLPILQSQVSDGLDYNNLTLKPRYDIDFSNRNALQDNRFFTDPDNTSKLKSVEKALFYSTVPGFLVHGLGHLYVDRPGAFKLLLSIEAASIGSLLILDWNNFHDDDRPAWKNMAVGSLFGVLFSTWIYDIYKSEQIANDIQMASRHSLTFTPIIQNNNLIPALHYSLRF